MGTTAAILSDVSFGLGLLNSLASKVDIIGIYSNGNGSNAATASGLSSSVINSITGTASYIPSFGQLFADARPMKATVRETSRVMEHPIETGSILADHHIINPVEIDIPMIILAQNYSGTYTQIRQSFVNATPLSVKTRTGVYQNMIIADMPHEEQSEMYNAIMITLRLKQVLLFTSGTTDLQSAYQPLDATNSNTISSGLQSAISISGSLLTAAGAAVSYMTLSQRI